MTRRRFIPRAAAFAVLGTREGASQAKTTPAQLTFSGHSWRVKDSPRSGPGPNAWNRDHAWVDEAGHLHLRLAERAGGWHCAEVFTEKKLGFGRYDFTLGTRVDTLDRQVVFGLFNYPSADLGPDSTREIDIEFARWGRVDWPNGNFTVWPVAPALKPTSETFEFKQTGETSHHCFEWTPEKVTFRSGDGTDSTTSPPWREWEFRPADAAAHIAPDPMRLHLNLWCHRGHPPTDARPVEIVIRSFTFTPTGG